PSAVEGSTAASSMRRPHAPTVTKIPLGTWDYRNRGRSSCRPVGGKCRTVHLLVIPAGREPHACVPSCVSLPGAPEEPPVSPWVSLAPSSRVTPSSPGLRRPPLEN